MARVKKQKSWSLAEADHIFEPIVFEGLGKRVYFLPDGQLFRVSEEGVNAIRRIVDARDWKWDVPVIAGGIVFLPNRVTGEVRWFPFRDLPSEENRTCNDFWLFKSSDSFVAKPRYPEEWSDIVNDWRSKAKKPLIDYKTLKSPTPSRKLEDINPVLNSDIDLLVSQGIPLPDALKKVQEDRKEMLKVLLLGYIDAFGIFGQWSTGLSTLDTYRSLKSESAREITDRPRLDTQPKAPKKTSQEEQGLLNDSDEWQGQIEQPQNVTAATLRPNEEKELLADFRDWLGVQPTAESGALSSHEKGLLSNLGTWLRKENEEHQAWADQLAHRQQTWLHEEEGQYEDWVNQLEQQDRERIEQERNRWSDMLPAENENLLSYLDDWIQDEHEQQLSYMREEQEEQHAWAQQHAEQLTDRLQQQGARDWREEWEQSHREDQHEWLQASTSPSPTESLSDFEGWLEQREASLEQQRNQQLSWVETHQEEQRDWLQQSRQEQNAWLDNLREQQQDWLSQSLHDVREGHLNQNQWYADFSQQKEQWQQDWQQQQHQWEQDWQQQQHEWQQNWQQQQHEWQHDWQRQLRS